MAANDIVPCMGHTHLNRINILDQECLRVDRQDSQLPVAQLNITAHNTLF